MSNETKINDVTWDNEDCERCQKAKHQLSFGASGRSLSSWQLKTSHPKPFEVSLSIVEVPTDQSRLETRLVALESSRHADQEYVNNFFPFVLMVSHGASKAYCSHHYVFHRKCMRVVSVEQRQPAWASGQRFRLRIFGPCFNSGRESQIQSNTEDACSDKTLFQGDQFELEAVDIGIPTVVRLRIDGDGEVSGNVNYKNKVMFVKWSGACRVACSTSPSHYAAASTLRPTTEGVLEPLTLLAWTRRTISS